MLNMIVGVGVVLKMTVVDSESCFDNLCGSYLQSRLHSRGLPYSS